MRINLDDCDSPLPNTQDAEAFIDGIPDELERKYFPNCLRTLAQAWLDLVKLTLALKNVMLTHYRPKEIKPSRAAIERNEAEIRDCYRRSWEDCHDQDPIVSLHLYRLLLYYE